MSANNGISEGCESCQFWLDDGIKKDDDNPADRPGICRWLPPVSVLTDSSVVERQNLDPEEWVEAGGRAAHDFIYWTQPRTLALDWCEKWKSRTPTEEPDPARVAACLEFCDGVSTEDIQRSSALRYWRGGYIPDPSIDLPPDPLREVAQAILEDAMERRLVLTAEWANGFSASREIPRQVLYPIRPEHYDRLKELLSDWKTPLEQQPSTR